MQNETWTMRFLCGAALQAQQQRDPRGRHGTKNSYCVTSCLMTLTLALDVQEKRGERLRAKKLEGCVARARGASPQSYPVSLLRAASVSTASPITRRSWR